MATQLEIKPEVKFTEETLSKTKVLMAPNNDKQLSALIIAINNEIGEIIGKHSPKVMSINQEQEQLLYDLFIILLEKEYEKGTHEDKIVVGFDIAYSFVFVRDDNWESRLEGQIRFNKNTLEQSKTGHEKSFKIFEKVNAILLNITGGKSGMERKPTKSSFGNIIGEISRVDSSNHTPIMQQPALEYSMQLPPAIQPFYDSFITT